MKTRSVIILGIILIMMVQLETHQADAFLGLLWQKTWGGQADDGLSGVAVDPLDNIYTAGVSHSFDVMNSDYARGIVLKYDAKGNLVWQNAMGTYNDSQALAGVAVDTSQDVYATGLSCNNLYPCPAFCYYWSPKPCTDLILLKLDSAGNLIWKRTYEGNGSAIGNGITADPSGDVYVAGYTSSPTNVSSSEDVLVMKFNSSGDLIWQKSWGGIGGDQAQAISPDQFGNIYVTGFTGSAGAGQLDAFILKFNPSGDLLWQRTWGGSLDEFGYGIATDSSGDVYVTGDTDSLGIPGPGTGAFLLKLDSAGNLIWQKAWDNSSGFSGGVVVSASGDVYVSGWTYSFANYQQAFLLKFDSNGVLVLQNTWGGFKGLDYAGQVATDSDNNAIVVGSAGEGPPYTLSQVNGSLRTLAFNLEASNLTSRAEHLYLKMSNWTASTPSGSSTYSGGADAFLFKYGSPATLLPPYAPLLAILPLAVLLLRSKKRDMGRARRGADRYRY